MKQLLSIATAAFLTCGLVGARASAGDCNSCDTCGSHGKSSFFSGGFFSKKSCGGCDTCSQPISYANTCDACGDSCGKKKLFNFSLFSKKSCGSSCGCETVSHSDCNTCDSCSHKSFKLFSKNDCGCDTCGSKKLSLPKINFFKRGCGCDSGCDTGCGGCSTCGGSVSYGGSASGGVIVQPAPAAGTMAPVPGTPIAPVQPAPRPAGAPAPVPVPAGS